MTNDGNQRRKIDISTEKKTTLFLRKQMRIRTQFERFVRVWDSLNTRSSRDVFAREYARDW